jgi:hypothetical protein
MIYPRKQAMQIHQKVRQLVGVKIAIGVLATLMALGATAAYSPTRDVWIAKKLTGGPIAFATTSFPFTISCTSDAQGNPPTWPPFSLTDNGPGAFSFSQPYETVPERTVGAVCTLTETRPAAPAGYVWTTPTSITFTVLPGPDGGVHQSGQEVLFPNTLVAAPAEPTGVPTLSRGSLWALALLMAALGIALSRLARRQR